MLVVIVFVNIFFLTFEEIFITGVELLLITDITKDSSEDSIKAQEIMNKVKII